MPFENFINPFQNPANVPDEYRNHPRLGRLFQANGTYIRPLEDPVTMWQFMYYIANTTYHLMQWT